MPPKCYNGLSAKIEQVTVNIYFVFMRRTAIFPAGNGVIFAASPSYPLSPVCHSYTPLADTSFYISNLVLTVAETQA